MNNIRQEFPIFKNHPDLVYLDSASTTQTPQVVLDAMNAYYTKYRANIHRGVYQLSGEATEMYEGARKAVAKFIGADFDEIIFTSGTTQGLNMLAQTLGSTLQREDNVVLTRMEHHANLIPWQEMSKRYGFEIRFIEIEDYRLKMKDLPIDTHTKIVSIVHVSNTLGTINPIAKIITEAKKVGAKTIVDAAQSVAHMPINVKKLDCDFLVFSGHKMYGPTGIGVVYGKREQLETLEPYMFGGDMIKEVTFESSTWHDVPWKFEAGTPDIAGAIGLAAAVQFVEKIGFESIQKHERELTKYALEELGKIEGLTIVGPTNNLSPYEGELPARQDLSQAMAGGEGVFKVTGDRTKKRLLETVQQTANRPHLASPDRGGSNRIGVISFLLNSIHTHDIATILDQHNIAVRAGHHCTMPLMQYLGIPGTTRASFGLYTTTEDVDQLIKGIKEVFTVFDK